MMEHFWSFALWAQLKSGEVVEFDVRLRWGAINEFPRTETFHFATIDEASGYVCAQVKTLLAKKYRPVRHSKPSEYQPDGYRYVVRPSSSTSNGAAADDWMDD